MEEKWIRSLFGHCIDDKIVEFVLGNDSALSFGGERKNLTILFSDIRSFTNYFEKQTPEEAVSNLNEYFTIMVDIIHRYGGTLDKFIGDAMMAEFGAPTHFPDHAERACLAALEMVRSLDRIRER
jgi:adenylate cyclase